MSNQNLTDLETIWNMILVLRRLDLINLVINRYSAEIYLEMTNLRYRSMQDEHIHNNLNILKGEKNEFKVRKWKK